MWQNIKIWCNLFSTFLALGCIAFGGPIAHIALFKQRFVEELGWLDAQKFAHYLVLCQCLPGPSSSQLGFLIGRDQGGVIGAFLAFLGFTLPSFLLMTLFAITGSLFWSAHWLQGILSGFILFAITVVASASYDLMRQFCTTPFTVSLCGLTVCFLLSFSFFGAPWFALALSICASSLWYKNSQTGTSMMADTPIQAQTQVKTPRRHSFLPLALWIGAASLLWVMPALKPFQGLFWTGSTVLGGGHVMLPFLLENYQNILPWQHLLGGYSVAQALPGPLFTMGAFVGASLIPENIAYGATLGCLFIFIPGFLFLLIALPFFESWMQHPVFRAGLTGACACVTGILIATFISPLFLNTINQSSQVAWIILGLLLLRVFKIPIYFIACAFAILGYSLH